MIKPDAIETYITLFENRIPSIPKDGDGIAKILKAEKQNLFVFDFDQLTKMLSISACAGEIDELAARTAKVIRQEVRASACVTFDSSEKWEQAIKCAEEISCKHPSLYSYSDREMAVAEAYKRLKSRKRKVSITPFGIRWDEDCLRNECSVLDNQIRLFGGKEVLNQIGSIFDNTNNVYRSIWLFGHKNLGINDPKFSASPYGWLHSLALKHVDRKSKASKPEKLWETIIQSSRDIATVFDCQRYSQFDGMFMNPTNIPIAIQQAQRWRELFTIQQVPRECLHYLISAMRAELDKIQDNDSRLTVDKVWGEFQDLSSKLHPFQPTLFSTDFVKARFPALLEESLNAGSQANRKFITPTNGSERNQSKIMFYKTHDNKYLCRPLSMSNLSFVTILFIAMWKRVASASITLGRVTETALEIACDGKADTVLARKKYNVGAQEFEFDVASQTGNIVTLMEIKNKTVTSKAEAGDTVAFISDMSNSVLPLIKQLARHEKHILEGVSPLKLQTKGDGGFQITKFAVSPQSFGGVTDNIFLKNLIGNMAGMKLTAIDSQNEKSIANFNEAAAVALRSVADISPKDKDGKCDIFPFFMRTRWIDFGQLVHLLHRSKSVSDALKPISHVSYSTRDLWSEIAHADRSGLADGVWSQV